MTRELVRKISQGAIGIAMGLVHYVLYVVALPVAFQSVAGLPVELRPPADPSIFLALLIALGVGEGIAPATVGAALGLLSKVVGSLYIYYATNGGVISVALAGYRATIDLSVLIYAIVAGSIIVGVVGASARACEGVSKV